MITAPLGNIDRDYRDLVIADLADAEAALLERAALLEAERRIYREIAIIAVHVLHGLHKQLKVARETAAMLRAERRAPQRELAA